MYKRIIIAVMLCVAIAVPVSHAHEIGEAESGKMPDKRASDTQPDLFELEDKPTAKILPGEVGVSEKLGQYIPLDAQFTDEDGDNLVLKNFIDQPTLILPVFFRCPQSCSILLANLANALNDIPFTPGREYKVIAISFDEEETPGDAAKAKNDYLNVLRNDFPEKDWKFLTGNSANIQAMTRSMGFMFKKLDAHNFVHPNVLICVAAGGKIIRYLYGSEFLPFDVSMAIAEAEKGTPGISIKKLVSYCFAYDPVGKKYVFRIFRIAGTAIIGLLAVLLFFLLKKNPTGQ
ncbi:MAG: SCO family protein [Desulfobacteraceae bacterium]|nr:MAG: SCO family protein [Desulfobacteraceae bacterium]